MKTTRISRLLCALLGSAALTVAATQAYAADPAPAKPAAKAGKEVTLTGDMVCGKCSLNETKDCQNVLKVSENGKETKYFLEKNEVAEQNHGPVCSGSAKATVKGTVKAKGKQKVLTASEITYAK